MASEEFAHKRKYLVMTPTENRNVVEVHGCIVCAKLFNILVVYSPDGHMVDCVVTSPDGHRVKDENRPLVACDTHTEKEIESAYKKWCKLFEHNPSN